MPTSEERKLPPDLYKSLGVEATATPEEIKAAWKKLARQWHPDANPGNPEAEKIFKEIAGAYQILSDPQKRATYDRFGRYGYDAPFRGGPNGSAGGTWPGGIDPAAGQEYTDLLWSVILEAMGEAKRKQQKHAAGATITDRFLAWLGEIGIEKAEGLISNLASGQGINIDQIPSFDSLQFQWSEFMSQVDGELLQQLIETCDVDVRERRKKVPVGQKGRKKNIDWLHIKIGGPAALLDDLVEDSTPETCQAFMAWVLSDDEAD